MIKIYSNQEAIECAEALAGFLEDIDQDLADNAQDIAYKLEELAK